MPLSPSVLSVLSEDLLARVYGFLDPPCRKTWRLVSREFHRIDSLSRTSIRVLRVEFLPALLSNYPNLSSLDLSVCPKLDDAAVLRSPRSVGFDLIRPLRYGPFGLKAQSRRLLGPSRLIVSIGFSSFSYRGLEPSRGSSEAVSEPVIL
ncbi:F-box/LRR-repeat protein 3-like [Raphanus sativus]|nr:F-box/LRR-repeat protein 3-like [Raphanus sativus]